MGEGQKVSPVSSDKNNKYIMSTYTVNFGRFYMTRVCDLPTRDVVLSVELYMKEGSSNVTATPRPIYSVYLARALLSFSLSHFSRIKRETSFSLFFFVSYIICIYIHRTSTLGQERSNVGIQSDYWRDRGSSDSDAHSVRCV